MSNLTIEDSESSFLVGKADFYEWVQNFMAQWYAPQLVDMLGIMVNTMPVEGKLRRPFETAYFEKVYRELRGG